MDWGKQVNDIELETDLIDSLTCWPSDVHVGIFARLYSIVVYVYNEVGQFTVIGDKEC